MNERLIWITLLTAISTAGYAGGPDSKGFAVKPSAKQSGDKTVISFAVSAPTDVEVAILAGSNVVRHLAAGVLGTTNTCPPLKDGLSQTLEWDGKDDFGKPASNGPFSARVRTGLGVSFDGFVAEDPYNLDEIVAAESDEEGNFYVEADGARIDSARGLRMFDSAGRYVRTILPFPADLPAGSMANIARFDESQQAWHPNNRQDGFPVFYQSSRMISASKEKGIILADPKEGLLKLTPKGAIETWPATVQSLTPVSDNPKTNAIKGGARCFAVSKDQNLLYGAGGYVMEDATDKSNQNIRVTVWRMKLDGKDKLTPFVSFPARQNGDWSKDSEGIYQAKAVVFGIALDARGNLYVGDRTQNRVAVFDPDGKAIGEVPVQHPFSIRVHPVTGAIYVLRRRVNGWGTNLNILEKYDSFAPGAAKVWSVEFFNRSQPFFALTQREGKTFVAVFGADTVTNKPDRLIAHMSNVSRDFLAYEDTGKEAVLKPGFFKLRRDVPGGINRMAVDSQRNEVYLSDSYTAMYRYNGLTGAGGRLMRNGKPYDVLDLHVDYSGNIIAQNAQGYNSSLERMDHELNPVPYPGPGTSILYDYIYGRSGIGFSVKGSASSPDGKVYCIWMYEFWRYFVGGWGPDGMPIGHYMSDRIMKSSEVRTKSRLPDNRKMSAAVFGPIHDCGGCIKVDLAGNVYIGTLGVPAGWTPYPQFAKDETGWSVIGSVGSVVKFRPEGGCAIGRDGYFGESKGEDPAAPRITIPASRGRTFTYEGALCVYPGVGPFSGSGSSCVCRVPRFDVDRFGRVGMPNSMANEVRIYDNAANLILKFGKYGNFDSQYRPNAGADKPVVTTPEIPLAWPISLGFSEDFVYVDDVINRRVVRARKIYAAEEICTMK